jgi:hypothetical protein
VITITPNPGANDAQTHRGIHVKVPAAKIQDSSSFASVNSRANKAAVHPESDPFRVRTVDGSNFRSDSGYTFDSVLTL